LEVTIASDEETVAELQFVHHLNSLLINTGRQPITKAIQQLGSYWLWPDYHRAEGT